MSDSRPKPLFENAGLAFLGEEAWAAGRLTASQAKLLTASHNPSGRPNADVLREFVGLAAGQITERTQIDFPLHFTEQEAALYLEPFRQLRAATNSSDARESSSSGRRPCLPAPANEAPIAPPAITQARTVVCWDKPGICPVRRPAKRPVATPDHQSAETGEKSGWWINPHANFELRTALARLERYLVTPLSAKNPQWHWIDSHVLPNATLLAVARDDDFTFGLLQSRFFACWWHHHASPLSPTEIVASFPFPWAPAMLLSALTRTQEEHRHAIARATRSGDQVQIDASVAAVYGWPSDLSDDEILAQLAQLNRERISPRLARM